MQCLAGQLLQKRLEKSTSSYQTATISKKQIQYYFAYLKGQMLGQHPEEIHNPVQFVKIP